MLMLCCFFVVPIQTFIIQLLQHNTPIAKVMFRNSIVFSHCNLGPPATEQAMPGPQSGFRCMKRLGALLLTDVQRDIFQS